MVGRAEFAYLIAQNAFASGLMKEEMFSVVIWSLLWATVTAPFFFRKVLMAHAARHPPAPEPTDEKPGQAKRGSGDFGGFMQKAADGQLGTLANEGGVAHEAPRRRSGGGDASDKK